MQLLYFAVAVCWSSGIGKTGENRRRSSGGLFFTSFDTSHDSILVFISFLPPSHPLKPVEMAWNRYQRSRKTPTANEASKIEFISIFTEIPSKLISAHTFAYISLDAMIPQEADQTHIEYGFPVAKRADCTKRTKWVKCWSRVTSGSNRHKTSLSC